MHRNKRRGEVRRSQRQRDLGWRNLEQVLFCCTSGAYHNPQRLEWQSCESRKPDNVLHSTRVVCGLQGTKVFCFVAFTHTDHVNHQACGRAEERGCLLNGQAVWKPQHNRRICLWPAVVQHKWRFLRLGMNRPSLLSALYISCCFLSSTACIHWSA